MSRAQLPTQIRKVEVTDRRTGKTVARYQLRVDGGVNPETGARQQVRRRYNTEAEARRALAEIGDQAVDRRVRCPQDANRRAGVRALPGRPAQSAGQLALEVGLRPRAAEGAARGPAGAAAHQAAHRRAGGRSRHRRHQDGEGPHPPPMGGRRVNKVVEHRDGAGRRAAQGLVAHNVAEHVDRVTGRTGGRDLHRGRGADAARGAGRRPAGPCLGAGAVRAAPRRDRRAAVGRCRPRWEDAVDREQPRVGRWQDGRERSEVGDVAPDAAAAGSVGVGAEGGQRGGRRPSGWRWARLPVWRLRGVQRDRASPTHRPCCRGIGGTR